MVQAQERRNIILLYLKVVSRNLEYHLLGNLHWVILLRVTESWVNVWSFLCVTMAGCLLSYVCRDSYTWLGGIVWVPVYLRGVTVVRAKICSVYVLGLWGSNGAPIVSTPTDSSQWFWVAAPAHWCWWPPGCSGSHEVLRIKFGFSFMQGMYSNYLPSSDFL